MLICSEQHCLHVHSTVTTDQLSVVLCHRKSVQVTKMNQLVFFINFSKFSSNYYSQFSSVSASYLAIYTQSHSVSPFVIPA